MKTPRPLGRRTVLRGFAGAPIALPLLHAMGPLERRADAAPAARRLVIYFVPIGTRPERWWPSGDGESFTIAADSCLAPVERVGRDVIILKGVDMKSTRKEHGAHPGGMANVLTGNGTGGEGFAGGPSVDQVLAQRFARATKFRSLELGFLNSDMGIPRGVINYAGPRSPVWVENNPAKVFDRIFGDLDPAAAGAAGSTAAGDLRRALRHSVLDGVKRSYESLRRRLGAEDRARIDQHLQSLSELEKQIDRTVDARCAVPARPRPATTNFEAGFDVAIADMQEDLLVNALKCDLTRVATFQWKNGAASRTPPELGVGSHHSMSHVANSNAAAREGMAKVSTWYTNRFARFVQRLKTEGLLDSTLVLHVTEVSEGDSHSYLDMPFILAGGGGYFRTGRYVTYAPKQPHNNLLVSVMNAMGQPDTTFGEPQFCTGPLPGLT
jgi:hypothetical protein